MRVRDRSMPPRENARDRSHPLRRCYLQSKPSDLTEAMLLDDSSRHGRSAAASAADLVSLSQAGGAGATKLEA
jgi:hypothetical protein